MTMREVLLEQLAAIYDENNWFVCYEMSIQDLEDYQVHESPDDEQTHSIAELLNHLYFYNYRYLCRFRGEEIDELPRYYDTFQDHGTLSWRQVAASNSVVLSEFRKEIKRCSDEKLEKWGATLSHLFIHNAYHIGQVVHIRKRFGTWSLSPVVRG
ncbi:DinB family protein [Halobacillus sp. K22]|uniref:DinB family protein n=1 Tax=Halobacillus sp. K22 TaxID=3457431 RepID=UPI003FCDD7C0